MDNKQNGVGGAVVVVLTRLPLLPGPTDGERFRKRGGERQTHRGVG